MNLPGSFQLPGMFRPHSFGGAPGTRPGRAAESRGVPETRLTVILISTHSDRDAAGLIASSAADGFLTKTDLSAAAVRTVFEAHERRGT
jgi:hypothetical protein